MTDQPYARGTVVKGPDLLGPHEHRPYVCLSTEDPPFRDQEAVYAVVTALQQFPSLGRTIRVVDSPVKVTSIHGFSSRLNTPIFRKLKVN